MTVEMEDRTGQPRRVAEIEEAIMLLKRRLTNPAAMMKSDPELFVNLLCIKDCLEELLKRRGAEDL